MWVKTSRGGEDKTGRSVAEIGQDPVGKPEGKSARERGVADVNTPFVRRGDVPEILRKGQAEPQIDSSGRPPPAEGRTGPMRPRGGSPAGCCASVRQGPTRPRCNRCNRRNPPTCVIPAGSTEHPGWPTIRPVSSFKPGLVCNRSSGAPRGVWLSGPERRLPEPELAQTGVSPRGALASEARCSVKKERGGRED